MENGSAVWKFAATFLAGIAVSMALALLTIGSNAVNQEEVIVLINSHSPYNIDRKLIFEKLEAQNSVISENTQAVRDLRVVMGRLELLLSQQNK